MIIEQPRRPAEEMHCPACDTRVPDNHPYSWCSRCGKALPADMQARLAKLQEVQRTAAERRAQAEEARTVALEVDGRVVPCPICGHDRFWTLETVMNGRGFAVEMAVNYVCNRCRHILGFLR